MGIFYVENATVLVTGKDRHLLETFRYWVLSQFPNIGDVTISDLFDRIKIGEFSLVIHLVFTEQQLSSIGRSFQYRHLIVYHDSLFELFRTVQAVCSPLSRCMNALDSLLNERPLVEDAKPAASFTRREQEVLELFTRGMSVKEVAYALKISPYTVASHQRNLYLKTNSHTLQQLILFTLLHRRNNDS